MGIFTDLFQLVSVAFGFKNNAKQFQENLEMAERYNRWGKERCDKRDYNGAIGCLDKCFNEDAPRGDCLVRKYCSYADSYLGCMELELATIREKIGQITSDNEGRSGELASLQSIYDKQQEHIKQLKSQGSMIQAAEEEGRAKETVAQLKRVKERQDEESKPEKLAVLYAGCIKEYLVYRSSLEMRLAEMNGSTMQKDESARILANARDRMALLDKQAVESTPAGIKPPSALTGGQ